MPPPPDVDPAGASSAWRPGRRWLLVAGVAVVAMSFNLRPVATAIGPVLEEISVDLRMGSGVAGVLTAMPGLVFGVMAGFAVGIARRLGVSWALAGALVVLGAGQILRSLVGNSFSLIALTAFALAGAAVANVLVPVFIKSHFGRHEANAMGAYVTALSLGSLIAALASAPIAATVSGGWRSSLGGWGLVALVGLIPWVPILRHERRVLGGAPRVRRSTGGIRIWRSPQAIALAAFFGVQSMHAYVQFGWVPQMFRDAGLSPTVAGALVALVMGINLPGGILMPHVVARVADLRPVMVVLGVLLTVGYLGILWAPTTMPWLWASCLGLSGMSFPTALALMTARTRLPAITARVSGFTQFSGYLLAGLGPFVVGAIHGLTGSWTVPLLALAAFGPVLAVLGSIAGRWHIIDDDLTEELGATGGPLSGA